MSNYPDNVDHIPDDDFNEMDEQERISNTKFCNLLFSECECESLATHNFGKLVKPNERRYDVTNQGDYYDRMDSCGELDEKELV